MLISDGDLYQKDLLHTSVDFVNFYASIYFFTRHNPMISETQIEFSNTTSEEIRNIVTVVCILRVSMLYGCYIADKFIYSAWMSIIEGGTQVVAPFNTGFFYF